MGSDAPRNAAAKLKKKRLQLNLQYRLQISQQKCSKDQQPFQGGIVEKRAVHLEAANRRIVNAVAAERGGGNGVSPEKVAELRRLRNFSLGTFNFSLGTLARGTLA